jgi:histidinol-phosphate aminotransferase
MGTSLAEMAGGTTISHPQLPLRRELGDLQPYGAPQLAVPVRLNVNENPYPLPPVVTAAVGEAATQAAAELNRYPDRDFTQLRQALADYLNKEAQLTGLATVTPEQIWAGNGSNEVMLHLFQAFGGPGHSGLTFTPSYSMYSEYARNTGTKWIEIPRLPDFSIDLDQAVAQISALRPELVVVASPNNPTGTALPLADIAQLATAARKAGSAARPDAAGLVIVDEAYGEFRRAGTPSALELLPDFGNLAVSRTMSKAFGAAGLRLGYLAASPQLIAALLLVRLPYHLSALTQATAVALLSQAEVLQRQVVEMREQRDALHLWLGQQKGRNGHLVTTASDANFVMFGRFVDRHQVWQQLLDQGVLIREVGPPGWLRVSIGTPSEVEAFKAALASLLPTTDMVPEVETELNN